MGLIDIYTSIISKNNILQQETKEEEEEKDENINYAELLCGNKLFEGSVPISHNYCGHQFGVFAGQLGDGRAITIGDIQNEEGSLFELQLKGAGKTPYSRQADGRAVLRSSIREYLASEYMNALGIPTTRAASLVVSDTLVQRDPLYKGNVIMEKCAVVMRVAPSFFRFGSFEIFKETDRYSGMTGPCVGLKKEMLPKMLDYILKYHYPHIYKMEEFDMTQKYWIFFEEIVQKTAKLVAQWQCYGFVHGVLNTDNMSALGLTIDYGPYQFMEYFNQDLISNHSDTNGRYNYEKQPAICKWNLLKLCEALDPLVDLEGSVNYVQSNFDELFSAHYLGLMGKKLGFIVPHIHQDQKKSLSDDEFNCIESLIKVMSQTKSDFTNTFRLLSLISRDKENIEKTNQAIDSIVKQCSPLEAVIKSKQSKVTPIMLERIKEILKQEPDFLKYLNISPTQARKLIEGQDEVCKLQNSNNNELKQQNHQQWKDWIGMYQETLSKLEASITDNERKASMDKFNPKFVLRNYLLEEAIKAAEKEDFTRVNQLLQFSIDPFNEQNIEDVFTNTPPEWALDICVSCSS